MNHAPFQGTDRFEPRRLLGSGTSGAVYEVWDRKRDCSVALKLLHQGDPAALYRFKQEFRALAHLSHPNLIQLYELQHEDDQWFVTMELIDGVDFVSYVRDPELMDRGLKALEVRLRKASCQLALGLRTLHASGRLHCDIKPSNVLVDKDGKVVILDFGLVTKATALQTFKSITEDILGTPAYMAPEQGGGEDLTEATDWYGVGALMYESLTGQVPFEGQFIQVMLHKQTTDPPPPREHVAEISADLNDLSSKLLRRDPGLRPDGLEVLEALGARDPAVHQSTQSQGPPVLIGRQASMERMWGFFNKALVGQQALGGEATVLYVHGASGLGKTVLVQRFLLEVRQKYPDAVTLSGRCYEHESVPYKAFDNMIDMLTRYLRSLPEPEAMALLPRDVLALARLFPVLRRVGSIADAERRVLEIPDSRELRRRAFAALREILTRMAEDHPLVLFIDDLQWGDFDSAGLLSAVMRPPDAPSLMLVCAYRDEDAATSLLLRELRPVESSLHMLPGEDLEVHELDEDAALELAASLLADDEKKWASSPSSQEDPSSPKDNDVARKIAEETHGNPLLIGELVRHTLAHGQVVRGGLDEVFRVRMLQLPAEARQLLEVLAVAGQPIEINVARRAAGLEPGELSAFTLLRVGNLARSTGARGGDQIGLFHDRVRKAVLAETDPARRRACHQHLARELEGSGQGDPEALAQHYAAAGEVGRALEYVTHAARNAAKALAFNRAARLYRRALDLQAADESQERVLLLSLAESYGSAGRGTDAAETYELLAVGAPMTEALDLRRQAAERWLVSGHVERGLDLLRKVLEPFGWKLETPRKVIPGLLFRRVWLRLRGYSFRERAADQVSVEELSRVDTCWSATIGLAVVDNLRAAAFQSRHLQQALAVGEPFRVARALALETSFSAAAGGAAEGRTRQLLTLTLKLANQVDDPYLSGFVMFTRGLVAYLLGSWKKALRSFEKARSILRDHCTGVAWEIENVHFYTLMTLSQLGRIHELQRRFPAQLKEARERGDLYSITGIRTRVGWLADLMADQPEQAELHLTQAIEAWSPAPFHLQHLWSEIGHIEVLLYAGESRKAWERIDARWRTIRSSNLLRVQTIFVDALNLRARAALSLAREDSSLAKALVLSARKDAQTIFQQKMPWTTSIGAMLRAGVAAHDGRTDEVLVHITAAEEGFQDADMALHAKVVSFRRGEFLGNDQGRGIREEAEAWMSGQGIQNPARLVAQMAPDLTVVTDRKPE